MALNKSEPLSLIPFCSSYSNHESDQSCAFLPLQETDPEEIKALWQSVYGLKRQNQEDPIRMAAAAASVPTSPASLRTISSLGGRVLIEATQRWIFPDEHFGHLPPGSSDAHAHRFGKTIAEARSAGNGGGRRSFLSFTTTAMLTTTATSSSHSTRTSYRDGSNASISGAPQRTRRRWSRTLRSGDIRRLVVIRRRVAGLAGLD